MKNENKFNRVELSFKKQKIMETLGATLEDVDIGVCKIKLPFDEKLKQQHGYFHGGVVSTIADSAAGYAAFTLSPLDSTVLTIDFKINFVAPARGQFLEANGKVIKSGRNIQVVTSEVYCFDNGDKTLCAYMVATIMNVNKQETK